MGQASLAAERVSFAEALLGVSDFAGVDQAEIAGAIVIDFLWRLFRLQSSDNPRAVAPHRSPCSHCSGF